MKITMDWLNRENACNEAMTWLYKNNLVNADDTIDMERVWLECVRGDWMLWLLKRLGVLETMPKRDRVNLCVRLVRETPLHDGRYVYDLLTDQRSIDAIAVCERYVSGEASDEELTAAYAAVYAAAAYAAYAAAAYAAAYAAVYAAAADAAYAAAAADAAAYAAAAVDAAYAAAYANDDAAAAYAAAAVAYARKVQAKIVREEFPYPSFL